MAIKEAGFDFSWQPSNPETLDKLDDPWFWPDDQQPIPREPNELEPFWR